jgi:hypothetical protein
MPNEPGQWPLITIYVSHGSDGKITHLALVPDDHATTLAVPAPRGDYALWSMWNTVHRVITKGGTGSLNADVAMRPGGGLPLACLELTRGYHPMPIRLPRDHGVLELLRSAVVSAMHLSTGVAEPTKAASTLRERAKISASQRKASRGAGVMQVSGSRAAAKPKRRRTAKSTPKSGRVTSTTGKKPVRESTRDRMPDIVTGIRFTEDPDAASKTVWAFKSGRSFHRRDCHLVEARDGAVRISIAAARRRKLERCMHCAPTVR